MGWPLEARGARAKHCKLMYCKHRPDTANVVTGLQSMAGVIARCWEDYVRLRQSIRAELFHKSRCPLHAAPPKMFCGCPQMTPQ